MGISETIRSIDRRLQDGTDNIASKANELIGISNYHISDVLFGAAGLVYTIPGLVELFGKDEPNFSIVAFNLCIGLGNGSYQIYRNKRLEAMESDQQNQESEAIAVDFELKSEKNRWIGALKHTPGKAAYIIWMVVSTAFANPVLLAGDISMLAAQYFRETDLINPTKKNKVFDLVRSLIPAKPESNYETITDLVQSNNYVTPLK